MKSECKQVPLEVLCSYGTDKVLASELTAKNYISTENMLPGKGGVQEAASLPAVEKACSYRQGDVLVSNIRPYFKKIWKAAHDGGCSNDVLVFRAAAGVDASFLYYVLANDAFFAYATKSSKGTKMPRGDKDAIMNYPVVLLPLPTQRKIAAILSSLDDKIENNNAICRNLEEQAAACYEKISSNGNCQPVLLGDIAQKVAMGPFGSNIKVSTFVESGVPIISGGHLHGKIVQGNEFNYITEEHAQRLKNSMVGVDDIVLTHAGNIGQVSIVSEDGEFSRYIISQRQFYLRCNQEKVFPLYVLFFLHSAYGQWQLLSFSSQTGVPSIAQPATNLKKIIMPMPPYQVQKQWFARVQPMYRLILKLMKETRRLAALRDTLLPKLMSGEIDVDKVSI